MNIGSNQISAEGVKALNLSSTLSSLDLGYNQIGDEGAKALSLNTTLTSLDIEYNQIGDEGAKALSLNTTLTLWICWNNQISNEILSEIEAQLIRNREALQRRRSNFVSRVILLNIVSSKDNKWGRLVPDVRRIIMDMVAEERGLGTTDKRFQTMCQMDRRESSRD